jgi:hypothetical protein
MRVSAAQINGNYETLRNFPVVRIAYAGQYSTGV